MAACVVDDSSPVERRPQCTEEELYNVQVMGGGNRRQAVAAESVCTHALRDYVKPVYPKAPDAHQWIFQVIKQSDKMQVLFGDLDDASLEDIVNAFRDVTANMGEDIIRQGEEGDCLYLIMHGQVDCFVARQGADNSENGGRGAKVASLGSGALFGELALMYSAPRAATVTIMSEGCYLWALDREPFRMLLASSTQKQFEKYEGWLSGVEIFKCLNHYELSRLSELLQSELFDDGEVIVRQGEPGDKFYILEDGSCSAFIDGEAGERKVKDYEHKGDYFGEIALLTDAPRRATVRANEGGAIVLAVSQEDFTSVLGPIQDLLIKDIGNYPQYSEFLQNWGEAA